MSAGIRPAAPPAPAPAVAIMRPPAAPVNEKGPGGAVARPGHLVPEAVTAPGHCGRSCRPGIPTPPRVNSCRGNKPMGQTRAPALSEQLRQAIRDDGRTLGQLTQAELATRSGLPLRSVQNW